MTVPVQLDAPNHVVGVSLREFLALGCRTGYLHLEQLADPWGRQEETSRLEPAIGMPAGSAWTVWSRPSRRWSCWQR